MRRPANSPDRDTGTKHCPLCDVTKPLTEFAFKTVTVRGLRTYQSYCFPCRSEDRRARLASRTEAEVKHSQDLQKKADLRRYYGIGLDEYERLVVEQDGRCGICNELPATVNSPGKVLHVDHDHATGRVRGLLCHRCNSALGLFNDEPARLRTALKWITDVDDD